MLDMVRPCQPQYEMRDHFMQYVTLVAHSNRSEIPFPEIYSLRALRQSIRECLPPSDWNMTPTEWQLMSMLQTPFEMLGGLLPEFAVPHFHVLTYHPALHLEELPYNADEPDTPSELSDSDFDVANIFDHGDTTEDDELTPLPLLGEGSPPFGEPGPDEWSTSDSDVLCDEDPSDALAAGTSAINRLAFRPPTPYPADLLSPSPSPRLVADLNATLFDPDVIELV